MTNDELWPRIPDYRYRIYAVPRGEHPHVLAAAPTPEAMGLALVTLAEDARLAGGKLTDEGSIGVLDVLPDDGGAAEWILLPWRGWEEA